MSRRRRAEKREILPDAKFGDRVVTKFMNNLMHDGKKSVAETIVYGALARVEQRLRKPPVEVFHEALRVTTDEGLLFFRDLARPVDQPTLEGLVERYAADCNEHQRQLFRDSLQAALTLDEMRSLVAELGFAPQTVQLTSDRHWTWAARRSAESKTNR